MVSCMQCLADKLIKFKLSMYQVRLRCISLHKYGFIIELYGHLGQLITPDAREFSVTLGKGCMFTFESQASM